LGSSAAIVQANMKLRRSSAPELRVGASLSGDEHMFARHATAPKQRRHVSQPRNVEADHLILNLAAEFEDEGAE
jgi:hypothetical protein